MSTNSLWWFLVFVNFGGYYLYSYAEIRSKNLITYYLGRIVVILTYLIVLLGLGIKAFLLFLPFSFIITPAIVGLVVDKGDKELQDCKRQLSLKMDTLRQEDEETVKKSLLNSTKYD